METSSGKKTTREIFDKAKSKALCGGVAAMGAQSVNVLSLMWMHTIMNVQYRYGGSFRDVAARLYADGGLRRFYRGVGPALISAPLSRFMDVAANEGAFAALENTELPVAAKTLVASAFAVSGRLALMPIDTWKTTKQVVGETGFRQMIAKSKKHPLAMWQGSLGLLGATWVGYYPWFFTNNSLRGNLPAWDVPFGNHLRHALIGFASSGVSDVCSNWLRVLKTTRQTSSEQISYTEAMREIVSKEGYVGLFGRGLKTRLLAKGISGAVFTVGWQATQELLERKVSG